MDITEKETLMEEVITVLANHGQVKWYWGDREAVGINETGLALALSRSLIKGEATSFANGVEVIFTLTRAGQTHFMNRFPGLK